MVVLSRMRNKKKIDIEAFIGRYIDESSIMAWELGERAQVRRQHWVSLFTLNMRTTQFVDMSRSSITRTWAATTITNWVKHISAFIKSTNCDHLVAIGDEGSYNEPSAATEPCQCVLFNCYFLTSQCGRSKGIDFEMPTLPLARLTLALSTKVITTFLPAAWNVQPLSILHAVLPRSLFRQSGSHLSKACLLSFSTPAEMFDIGVAVVIHRMTDRSSTPTHLYILFWHYIRQQWSLAPEKKIFRAPVSYNTQIGNLVTDAAPFLSQMDVWSKLTSYFLDRCLYLSFWTPSGNL